MVPEKSLGTGIGKIWYRKKVSEPVLEKLGTEKSTGIGIENIWYRKKVLVSVAFNVLGAVTRCSAVKYSVSMVIILHLSSPILPMLLVLQIARQAKSR